MFSERHFGVPKGVDGRLNGVPGWKERFQSSDHEAEDNSTYK